MHFEFDGINTSGVLLNSPGSSLPYLVFQGAMLSSQMSYVIKHCPAGTCKDFPEKDVILMGEYPALKRGCVFQR